jgi:UDP-N-acetylmuramoyl-L-alanyl-D-glutamate--2,6-diaminopimelate ligase
MAMQHFANVSDALTWFAGRSVSGLASDSRRVAQGDAFIAWPGHVQDARKHVPQALAAGAAACLIEADGAASFGFDDPRVGAFNGLKPVAGVLASAYFGEPSGALSVIAVTGTNGKTSTAWWTAQALSLLGRRCGIVGTLGVGEVPATPRSSAASGAGGEKAASQGVALVSTGLTTPDPITLQRAFRRFVDEGFAACAIEASSIGIAEQRLSGTRVQVAVFTNLTQDHLDFHGTMEAYWQAKAELFDWPGLGSAAINIDDARGAGLAEQLAKRSAEAGDRRRPWTFGVEQGPVEADSARTAAAIPADASAQAAAPISIATRPRLLAKSVRYVGAGLAFDVVETDPHTDAVTGPLPVHTLLLGDYNVSNLLAVMASLRALGVTLADAARVCSRLQPVPGRMERVGLLPMRGESLGSVASLPEVLVDYAHTPDALEKALLALQPLVAARQGALWCVFGCGGNRDAGKRPLMGAIAQSLAQHVVVTSDNPRDESPATILSDIVGGMQTDAAPWVIESRHDAIARAIHAAGPHDVVLIAGKGHETTQEIAGVRHPFSDVAEARAALATRSPRGAPGPISPGTVVSPSVGPMGTSQQGHS